MISFKSLFGIPQNEIQKTCILTPFLTKGLPEGLGIAQINKGHPYAAGNGDGFTLLITRIGPAFSGDCVLHLKDSPCENIILFGSCGLLQQTDQLKLGALVTPTKCLEIESFSQMLNKNLSDENFIEVDAAILESEEIPAVTCATVGSIQLEYEYFDFLRSKEVDVVDMEASAVFHAAKYIGRKTSALFYITDILNQRHALAPISSEEQDIIDKAMHLGSNHLLKITNSS